MHHQPKLFKTHQEQLSTAKQGIISVPTQAHKKKEKATSKKLSPLKQLFTRKGKLQSEASGSQMSIDYGHFSVSEVDQSLMAKRFSESHVNPDVNFDEEGRLAQATEVQIELPTTQLNEYDLDYVDSDQYDSDGHYPGRLDAPYTLTSPRGLPVTSIDDVAEEANAEFQHYERVQHADSVGDFAA